MPAERLEQRLKTEGINLDVIYKTDGPNRERILEQADINGSMDAALNVAKKYGKKNLVILVEPINNFSDLKRASYQLSTEFVELYNNGDLTLHEFLLAKNKDKLSIDTEISRYFHYIQKVLLEELKPKPNDYNRRDCIPPSQEYELDVNKYCFDRIKLQKLHLDKIKTGKEKDTKLVFTGLTAFLKKEQTGRAYQDEAEYLEKEIIPVFNAKSTAHDVAKAIYAFKAALNKKFPRNAVYNYHEGQLRRTELALADLLQMAKQVRPFRERIEDISDKVDDSMLELIGKELFGEEKKPSRMKTALLDDIFTLNEIAEELSYKERKGKELVLNVNAPIYYTK